MLQCAHIGSTAVPGLAAKPVIDVMAAVSSAVEAATWAPLLAVDRWQYLQEHGIPGRHFFVLDTPDGIRSAHLHVVEPGTSFWLDHLLFGRWLRAHPLDVEACGRLKERLAREHRFDAEAYCDAKAPWISAAMDRAWKWAAPVSAQ